MSALAKVFVVLVFILSVAFFGTSATLFKIRLDWKTAYEKVEKESKAEFERLKGKVEGLVKEIDEKNNTIFEKDAELLKLGADVKSLQSDLTEEKNKVELARSQQDSTTQQNETLTKSLEAATQERQTLMQTLETLRAELGTAQEDARQSKAERDSVVVDLNTEQIARHEAEKALQTISSERDTLAMINEAYQRKYGQLVDIGPRIDALVKNVDNEQGLVVLSMGEDDKVQIGREFTVYRGDAYIGTVKVIRLYPNLSGARILWLKEGQEIRIGDKASTGVGLN